MVAFRCDGMNTFPETMHTTPLYRRRTTCRLCDSADVTLVFRLEPTPPAEWYFPPDRAGEADQCFPLDLFLCRACGHVQIFDIIDPVRLFTRYAYTSASSPGLDDHFRRYAEEVMKRCPPAAGTLTVDVGSNDGTLLKHFKQHGLRVLGIDPAAEIAHQATAAGIPTLNSFMDASTAAKILADMGPASLVTANNVFAHSDDLGSMADAIASIMAADGAFVFEVSNLLDTVEGLVFDFIYHEHLCYHSVKPMEAFLRHHGMHLFDVERVSSKGGSLRGFAQHLGGPRAVSPSVSEFIRREEEAGLYRPETYDGYIARVNRLREETLTYLLTEKAKGRSIAGYGASATVTTLLYHFQLGNLIEFIVDDNPIRHGTVSPGHHIPVFPTSALYERNPDIVVTLAWRFADQMIERHQDYLQRGGRFLVPLPVFRLVDKFGLVREIS
jgi:SAM-dependent methyltransferase